MAEKKGVGHAYNVDFLNVVFAASSIFLLLSTIWMVWDDYDRDWKNTQRRFAQLQYDVTRAQYRAAARSVDRTKLQQLQAQLKASEKNAAANQKQVDAAQAKLDDVNIRLDRTSRDYQYSKATYDHDRYDFEASRAAGESGAAKKGELQAEDARKLHDLDLQVQQLTADRNAAQQVLNRYIGSIGTLQKQIEEMRAEQMRLRKVAETQAPSLQKDLFLNAPLLDFMAPTIKIQQIILPDVVDDVNFKTVPKMDRCTTCHLGIDKKGFEKYPQPFTTHPNLDAYLGSKSPHPIDRIGCTVCHQGMGQSVSFRDASHTPTGEKQKDQWERKYGWEEPHEWDYPMLPTKMTEAACTSCHRQEIYIPTAPQLNVAYATFERAGCYACHKTRGFENVKKPGPILTKIASKLTQDWVKTWVRNPRAVKQTTWMPRIWYNSNSSSPQDAVRNEVEINAAVAYLFANSETWDAPVKNPPHGDAKAGEKIVKSIGCQGCHVVGEGSREAAGPHRTFGQPLENIGNKTTYEWVFNWVRDPKHYNANTYMPNLRLTDPQAADVATYLMTLKQTGGDQPKATYTQKDVDDTLLDYYTALMPAEEAKAAVAKLDTNAKQLDLGQKVINRYGCFSCHDIKGFEKTQPIGTDLSEEGSKLVTRLDFGFVNDIPHTSKIAWFNRKLHDPRIFDKGRVLQPLDKLRMPNFDFSDTETERLLTAIMSFQRATQPPAALPVNNARRDYTVAGRALVHRRNCVGCHIIEDDGGDFAKQLLTDASLGPPRLTPEGVRVQPDWLYAFLRGPIQIRPWIDVRMPTFGLADDNLNGVIHYFQAVSNNLEQFRTYDVVAKDDAAGKALFEKLQCQKCHVLGEIPKDQPTANLAPDLRMVHERLNPDWLLPWLKNPASFLPGTRMTQFWPDYPKSPYPEMGGDADAQMRAIIAHLESLRGGPSPRKAAPANGAVATN